jgi:hypothetical protein
MILEPDGTGSYIVDITQVTNKKDQNMSIGGSSFLN